MIAGKPRPCELVALSHNQETGNQEHMLLFSTPFPQTQSSIPVPHQVKQLRNLPYPRDLSLKWFQIVMLKRNISRCRVVSEDSDIHIK